MRNVQQAKQLINEQPNLKKRDLSAIKQISKEHKAHCAKSRRVYRNDKTKSRQTVGRSVGRTGASTKQSDWFGECSM